MPGLVVELNTVPVPYKGINFTEFISQTAGTAGLLQGVVPQSGTIIIANGPLSPTQTPALSLTGTSTKKFDLRSFFYGCLVSTQLQEAQLSTACTFIVSGVKAGTAKAVAPVTFKFTPNSKTAAAMQKASFGPAFSGLQSATIQLLSSDVAVCRTCRALHLYGNG